MKDLQIVFDKVGIFISPELFLRGGMKLDFLCINNPDGSIRWMWPDHVKKPLFLKFYNASSIRSKIFVAIIKSIFFLRIQKLICKKRTACFAPSLNSNALFPIHSDWAVFTGTPGPNRKAVFYFSYNNESNFLKVACSSNARALSYNESFAIDILEKEKIERFTFPKASQKGLDVLQLEDISNGGRRSTEFNMIHMDALRSLVNISSSISALKDIPAWQEALETLEHSGLNQDARIPRGLVQKLKSLVATMDDSIMIETSVSHGDFTPWNMYEKNGKLNIYDWELSRERMPIGFDAFHFIIQQGILSERKNWTGIHDEIRSKISPKDFSILSYFSKQDVNLYLKLYLILNTITYLDIYSQQEKWHVQISWLLNAWNEALSSIVANPSNQRGLVLKDAFDFLQNLPYATLKFPNQDPQLLSEFSDVDLCVERSTASQLIKYISNHSLVAQAKVNRNSNMCNLQLTCHNGEFLSLDCIWNLKRKATILMNADSIISRAALNEFGVKMPAALDEARYIALFYSLNNAPIPQKYIDRVAALQISDDILDKELYDYSRKNDKSKASIKKHIGQKRENRFLYKFRNHISYWFDVILSLFHQKGMVITFSGVDGAGKSTVIDSVKKIVEKKFRKNVVVIRHRPSLLPILSAWVEGKAAAEKKAASTLPRQGNNKHWLSSLLRFSYYYADYLLGQFVVYFRYVLRGHIVLYDRYYFDFINDSKRSNIQLPRIITSTGYKLLLKPDLNFFLYAKPDLILSRKRELMASTIEQLTKKYLDLFEKLNRNAASRRYVPIENIVLEDTVESVIQSMIKTAA